MRRAKDDFLQQNLSWFRHCEVEIVVADQTKQIPFSLSKVRTKDADCW